MAKRKYLKLSCVTCPYYNIVRAAKPRNKLEKTWRDATLNRPCPACKTKMKKAEVFWMEPPVHTA